MEYRLYKGAKGRIGEATNLNNFRSRVAELNYGNEVVTDYCLYELSVYLNRRCKNRAYGCYELTDKIIEKLEEDYFDRRLFSEEITEELKKLLKKIGSASRYVTDWKNERLYIYIG